MPMICYRIDVHDAQAHLFRVTLNIPAPSATQKLSLPVWISFMQTALTGVPVSEYSAPEGVVNVGGEWFYEEYARSAGVSGVGLESGTEPLTIPLPPAEEKKQILDLFRN